MANLPQVPRRFAVTPQVESSISGADVARPYQIAAQAIGAVGSKLGEMADHYEKTVETGYLAREGLSARETADKLALEANGDPAVFDSSMNEYRRARISASPPGLRDRVDLMIDSERVQSRGPLITAKFNSDTKQAENLAKARIDQLDDQLSSLAMNGQGASEDYRAKAGELSGIYRSLADNPAFDLSPEEADIALKRAESRHMAESMVGSVQRVYARDGMAAAQKAADLIRTDTTLDLSPAERRQYSALAMSDIKASDAERRADLRLFRPEAQQVLSRLKAGEGLDDSDVDEAIKTAGELGDPVLASNLIRARASGRFVREFQGQTDTQQLAVAQQSIGDSDGVASYVDRVVQIESAGDPNARAGTSSATGLGQFTTGTWGAFLADRHPDLIGAGKDFRTDPALSKEAVAWYAEKNAADLQAAGQQATPGNLYLAHFLGPQGAIDMLSADSVRTAASVNPQAAAANKSVFYAKDGTPRSAAEVVAWASTKMGGASAPRIDREALVAMRTEITSDAKNHWTSIKAGFLAGTPPPADEIREFAQQVALVDDGDFREQVANQLSTYADGYLLGNMPTAEADQLVDTIRKGAGEDGYSQIERDALATFKQARDDAATAIKADAVGYGQSRSLIAVPPPLDFSTPEAAAAGMAGREKAAAQARTLFGAASVPAVRPAEAESIAATIATGPPEQAQNALTAVANVSDDSLAATIGMTPIKDAIGGAVRGNDPQKFSSAMTALDTLWARAPETVSTAFGKDVIDSLQDWQAKLRYYTPDELVNELKTRADPQAVERRKRLEETGRTEFRKKSADTVVGAFDPGYLTTGPGAPIDPLSRDMFMADAESLYAGRYAATLDDGTAMNQTVARMRGKWTASALNGGRITYLAPESVYPPHDGSWQWMHDQLSADLSTFGNEPSDFSVVADRTTEAEMQAGKQPSYLVTIKRAATGEFDLVRNADGKPMRYAWDTSKAQTDEAAKFKAERERVLQGVMSGGRSGGLGGGGWKDSAAPFDVSSFVPVNARLFVSTLFGSRADITAADFGQEDKAVIVGAVQEQFNKTGKREGMIGYGDYGQVGRTDDFSRFDSSSSLVTLVMDSFNDPRMRLETSLGMARYKIEDDGSVVITDRYRFDANRSNVATRPSLLEAFGQAGWTGVLNLLGNTYGPTEDEPGRKVHLRLGKVKV